MGATVRVFFPRISEHLAGEKRSPPGGGLDLFQPGAKWRVGAETLEGEPGFPQNRGQEVVEVMGDPAGHHSEAFEFLCLADLIFEPLLLLFLLASFGDVPREREQAELAVAFFVADSRPLEPTPAAVGMPDPVGRKDDGALTRLDGARQ